MYVRVLTGQYLLEPTLLKNARVQQYCNVISVSVSKKQLVTSLTGIDDLLRGCPNNSDTDLL